MKSNLTIIAMAAALATGLAASAQDYDDIYYDASKEAKGTTVVTTTSYDDYSNDYSNVTTYQYDNSYVAAEIVNGRDVDEYNRRGSYDDYYYDTDSTTTTVTTTATTTTTTAPDYTYTTRIRRFDNPVVVVETNTNPLIDGLALITAAAIAPVATWAWLTDPWDWGWYGGWYGGWYSPYYYSPWRYTWYGPSYYGWGCYGPYYGGWYGPGPHHGPYPGPHHGPGYHGGWGDPGRHGGPHGGYAGGRRPNHNVGGSRPVDGGSHGGPGGHISGGSRGANRPGTVSGAGRNNVGRSAVGQQGRSVRPDSRQPRGGVSGSNGSGTSGRRPGVSSTPSGNSSRGNVSRPNTPSRGSSSGSSRGSVSRPSGGSHSSGRSGGFSGGGRSGGFGGGGRSGGFGGGGGRRR